MFDFSGKNVVVMGGTSGINYGIACGFAKWGAKIVVASRNQEKVDKAVAGLKELGAEAAGVSLDVRDYEAVEKGFETAVAFFGGTIDILISGAAGNFPSRLLDMSPNGVKSVVDIDLLGTFHVMRASHQHLTKPGASVVNISAPQAFYGTGTVCSVAGTAGFEPANAGIKTPCLNQLGDVPTVGLLGRQATLTQADPAKVTGPRPRRRAHYIGFLTPL